MSEMPKHFCINEIKTEGLHQKCAKQCVACMRDTSGDKYEKQPHYPDLDFCQCKDCKSGETALQRQLDHEFYKDADAFRNGVKMETLKKAAVKYPEPFDPSKWTIEELAKHAMAENYDQQNYIYGMYERLQTLEKRNNFLELEYSARVSERDIALNEVDMHRKDVLKFEAEEDRLIDFLNSAVDLKKYDGQKVVDIAIKLIGSLQGEAEYWRLRLIEESQEKGKFIDERI